MKKNKILMLLILSVSIISLTSCGKKSKTSQGTAVKYKGGKISANTYYDEIKESQISKLIDLIDHKLLDEDYPKTDDETSEVQSQIDLIKQYYSDEDTFNNIIKQYYGVSTEEELEDMLRLEYKRTQAVNDYIEDNLTENEIQTYYDEKVTGQMKASHILIAVDVESDASDEEKEEKENEALKKANEIIEKLNNDEDFSELAKEYSDDDATKDDGGDLGYFDYDEMEEAFSEAVKNLEVDSYTKEPVKTSYGYHIILKTGQKDKDKLEDIEDEIKEKLREEKLNADNALYYETLLDFRESKGVTFEDDALKNAYEDYMQDLIESAS